MLKIGLTGGIGSGKSTVAKLFAELNVPVIDADYIVRELTTTNKNVLSQIKKHFGAEYFTHDRKLDRKKLRDHVFKNETDRTWLEDLLHPLVFKAIKKQLRTIKAPYVILVIPLLFETQATELVDRTLAVDCPETLQITRITARDQVSKKAVKAIIQSQIPRKIRCVLANDLIPNTSSITKLKQQVKKLHAQYLNLS